MDLPDLDDNVLGCILAFLPWADIGSLPAVCRSWHRSLESRDALWLALLDRLEEHWARRPGGNAFLPAGGADSPGTGEKRVRTTRALPPPRQSKRIKQSGRQKLVAAVRCPLL